MSKILFLACAYNRPKVLRLALMGLNRLKQVHDFEVLVACSDSDSLEVCKEFDVDCYEYKNLPIGEKKNDLFERGLEYNADYFIEFADDDLLSNELFEAYLVEMAKGTDYIRPKGLYFYDTQTKRCLEFNPDNTFGAFRVFSRELIENVGNTFAVTFRQDVNQFKEGKTYEIKEKLYCYLMRVGVISLQYTKFEIWNKDINHALDFSSEARIIENGYKAKVIDLGTPQIIDVKSDQNIWKFEKYWTRAKDVPKEAIFDLLSKEEIKYLKTL